MGSHTRSASQGNEGLIIICLVYNGICNNGEVRDKYDMTLACFFNGSLKLSIFYSLYEYLLYFLCLVYGICNNRLGQGQYDDRTEAGF